MGQLNQVLRQLKTIVGAGAQPAGDEELLERFVREQDQAAFEALMRRHAGLVLGVCRRVLQHQHDAEDAFQATFLLLVRKAPTMTQYGSLARWLHTVALHTSLRLRERISRRKTVDDSASPAEFQEPKDCVADLRPVLDEEVQRLPIKYRDPVLLCYLQGKATEQAAQELGCPRGTILSRLSRARDILKERLERRGIALSSASLVAALSSEAVAAVPPALLHGTLETAVASTLAAAVPSTIVHSLAEDVARRMLWSQMRTGLMALAVMAVVGVGILWTAQRLSAPNSTEIVAPPIVDLFGDPLPPGAIARLGTARWMRPNAFGGDVVAFSPDGRFLACAGESIIRVFSIPDGKPVQELHGHKQFVYAVQYSPCGTLLASAGHDRRVILWDSGTGSQRWSLSAAVGAGTNPLAFSPDGKFLALAAANDDLTLWDTASGSLHFRPSARRPNDSPSSIGSVAFSADGRALAHAHGSTVRILDVDTKAELASWSVASGAIHCLAWSESLLAAGTDDGTIIVRDDERERHRWTDLPKGVYSLAFAGEVLAAGDGERQLHLFSLKENQPARTVTLSQASEFVAVTASSDGNMLALGSTPVQLLDRNGISIHRYTTHSEVVRSMAVTPDGASIAVADAGGRILLWNVLTGRPLRELRRQGGDTAALEFSPDGTLLALGDSDGNVLIVDVAREQIVHELRSERGVLSLSFSGNGSTLAATDGGPVRLIDVANGRWAHSLGDGPARRARFDPVSGLLVACGKPHLDFYARSRLDMDLSAPKQDHHVHVWNPASGACVVSLDTEAVAAVLLPGGQRLVCAGGQEGTLDLWDLDTRRKTRLRDQGVHTTALAVTVDGERIAVGVGPEVVVWSSGGELLARLRGHQAGVLAVRFTPDGKHLVSGSADRTALVWKTP